MIKECKKASRKLHQCDCFAHRAASAAFHALDRRARRRKPPPRHGPTNPEKAGRESAPPKRLLPWPGPRETRPTGRHLPPHPGADAAVPCREAGSVDGPRQGARPARDDRWRGRLGPGSRTRHPGRVVPAGLSGQAGAASPRRSSIAAGSDEGSDAGSSAASPRRAGTTPATCIDPCPRRCARAPGGDRPCPGTTRSPS